MGVMLSLACWKEKSYLKENSVIVYSTLDGKSGEVLAVVHKTFLRASQQKGVAAFSKTTAVCGDMFQNAINFFHWTCPLT